MWALRSRRRDEEERYREHSVNRLRDVSNAVRSLSEADPEVTRARLERMRHGATRSTLSGESPA